MVSRTEILEELTELDYQINSLQHQIDAFTDSITRYGDKHPDLDKTWTLRRRRLMALRDQLKTEFNSVKSRL